MIGSLSAWLLGLLMSLGIWRIWLRPMVDVHVSMEECEGLRIYAADCYAEIAQRLARIGEGELAALRDSLGGLSRDLNSERGALENEIIPATSHLQRHYQRLCGDTVSLRDIELTAHLTLVESLRPIAEAYVAAASDRDETADEEHSRAQRLLDRLGDILDSGSEGQTVPEWLVSSGATGTIPLSNPRSLRELADLVQSCAERTQLEVSSRRQATSHLLDRIRGDALPQIDAIFRDDPGTASSLLSKCGLEWINPERGALSEPLLHDEVALDDPVADCPPGHILRVVKPGYLWGDVVLRKAQVVVADEANDE